MTRKENNGTPVLNALRHWAALSDRQLGWNSRGVSSLLTVWRLPCVSDALASIEENGKTYNVENKAGKGFLNEAQKGNLKIVKTSSDGKVEGFSFRVIGKDYDQTFTTDKKGEITVEGLRIGEYTVSEVSDKVSSGYILPADQKVTIKTDETAVVTMHNELRDTPRTGDDFSLGLWVSLAAAFTVGAGIFGFAGYKCGRKKKED